MILCVQCPAIVTALALARNPLLVAIRTNLSHDSLAEVSGIITTVIVDEAAWQKSLQARNQQECFAIRPHVDGSLDAARKVRLPRLRCIVCINSLERVVLVVAARPLLAIGIASSSTRT